MFIVGLIIFGDSMSALTNSTLDELVALAQHSPRQRSHHNVHPTLDAKVQRLAIAMEPDTYVRPHRHPQTWELYIPLRGAFQLVIFDDNGSVRACHRLGHAAVPVFELPANTWHAVLALESGSVIFEVKEGPYIKPDTADVAAWSPAEGDDDGSFMTFLRSAVVGARYTSGK